MPTLYEKHQTGDDTNQGLQDVAWKAMTFTPSVAHKITSVKLFAHRIGSPGTMTVSIRATDVNGKPTGADLISGTTNANTLTTDTASEWREITLGTGTALAANTKYAIVARCPSGNDTNLARWRAESIGTYTGGQGYSSADSGSTWDVLAVNQDMLFEDWGDSYNFPTPRFIPVVFIGRR